MALNSRQFTRRYILEPDSPPRAQDAPPLFINNDLEARYHANFVHRAIVEGKQFECVLLSKNGLRITHVFHQQGIVNFLCIKENIYPKLISLFYANLHYPMN